MKTMKRPGLVAQKMGMTTLFLEGGRACPVTIFALQDCAVISVRQDGDLLRVQIGAGAHKNVSKPLSGHFSKNNVAPKRYVREFAVSSDSTLSVGDLLRADYFGVGCCVDVTGTTIGRGFAGAMKRHNFGGLRATHGVSVSHRSHGSTGHRKDPSRVFKGKKMAGHMGCQRVTVLNLPVMAVDVERGLVVVKGATPGHESSWVMIRDAIKKPQSADPLQGVTKNKSSVDMPVDI